MDEDVGLQVRRVGISLDDVSQRGARDHSGRIPIKPLIQPKKPISRPKRGKLAGDDCLESRADLRPWSMSLGQAAHEQVNIIDGTGSVNILEVFLQHRVRC